MKQLNPAPKAPFLTRLALLSIFILTFGFAQAQCPLPYPKGDLDTTLRNVPVSTVVTANDVTTFGSGAPLSPTSLVVSTAPGHGTAVVVNDSTILYTPFPGYVGTDFYTYTVCNACGNCAQGSVTIAIAYYCPAPLPITDLYTLYNDRANNLNVAANDINIAGGPVTVSIRRAPLHGTATMSGNNIVYQSNGVYTGPDTLSYVICDSCPTRNCDTGFVYIDLVACQKPAAVNDSSTLIQGSTLAVNLTANDTAVTTFGSVSVTLLNGPRFGSTATLSGRTLTYRASATQFGIDTIAYAVCTDCGCDTALAIFTVTQAPCRKPTAFADNEYTGYSSTCSTTHNILGNDILPLGGGALTVTIVTQPAFGRVSIVNNRLVYTCLDSTRLGQIDLIRYSVCNACFCDTGTVAMHISNYVCNGRNPVINKDTTFVCRNYPVRLNVTANDVDAEGTVVSVDTIVGQAQNGIARKVNGTNVSYTPNPNFTGQDFFVYSACDAGTPKLCNIATVVVYVQDCNSPPVILGAIGNPTDTLHASVYEDSFMTYCFQYTQADSPYVYISSISVSLDTVTPTAGSTTLGTSPCVRIAPPFQFRNGEQVQVVICNAYPLCDTVLLIIDIVPINHHPDAFPDVITYTGPCSPVNVIGNDSDDDLGDHIVISSFDSVTMHGGIVALVGDSSLCYTPDTSFAGTDTFYYIICDTSLTCDRSFVTVTVGVIARDDQATTIQDQPIHIDVAANDSRTATQYITLCGQPEHGTATVDSGHVLYTPERNYPVNPLDADTSITQGVDSFCYTLCSVSGTDTSCASAYVTVVVTAKGRFYIPQGISPNGDGVNDKFVIPAVDELPKSQLLVFNRYGDEVWRNDGDGYLNDFDGTWKKNGQPLPDMSYWYIFKFNDGVHPDRMGYIIIER